MPWLRTRVAPGHEPGSGTAVEADPGAVLWALKSVVIDRLSIAQVAEGLGASWHTVNDAVLCAWPGSRR